MYKSGIGQSRQREQQVQRPRGRTRFGYLANNKEVSVAGSEVGREFEVH